ncbi:MAG TPA: hypothetical protein VNE58_15885 [Casimicrobiaceae bacterium]|nr:hypothetical protein [Casimicrobiaceae bacterium]
MADFPAPQGSTGVNRQDVPSMAALVAYILLGLAALMQIGSSGLVVAAPLFTFVGFIGVIIAYVKRGDSRGTWVESHMTLLIRTFWWSTIWAVIGFLLMITIIGIPFAVLLWAIVAIWVLYRVIKGVIYFKDSRPVPL